jgi:NAD(P)-dependent dehydrogenase (short-subunit alcohol dehydrogenase family)
VKHDHLIVTTTTDQSDIRGDIVAAYVITGPTAGIGRRTALEVARHGTVVLVGRNPAKLADVRSAIDRDGGSAVSVVCDLSDPADARRAAAEIAALDLAIAGVLNNAGLMQTAATTTARGWDTTFATNHLGPFAFTEALVPHLADGTNVVFVCSAVENPDRRFARMAGFRGGRYISAAASARGEWEPGGSSLPGGDAYATSKQCNLATVLEFAREFPQLRFNAVEPGFCPGSDLGRDSPRVVQALMKYVISPVAPLFPLCSNPATAARMITTVLTSPAGTGAYYDEKGRPMRGSTLVHDPEFDARVVAETRELLADSAG